MGDAIKILSCHPRVCSEVGTDAAMLVRSQLDKGEEQGVNGGEGGSREPVSPWGCRNWVRVLDRTGCSFNTGIAGAAQA